MRLFLYNCAHRFRCSGKALKKCARALVEATALPIAESLLRLLRAPLKADLDHAVRKLLLRLHLYLRLRFSKGRHQLAAVRATAAARHLSKRTPLRLGYGLDPLEAVT